MIRLPIETYFSIVALHEAYKKLIQETKVDPVGLILGLDAAKDCGEILSSNKQFMGLRLDIVPALPSEFWTLYNGIDYIISGKL